MSTAHDGFFDDGCLFDDSGDLWFAVISRSPRHINFPPHARAAWSLWWLSASQASVTVVNVRGHRDYRGRGDGVLMGYALTHPNGGPQLALRLDPEWAERSAGFDYFSIGVPDRTAIESLAERLSAHGDSHEGVHFASIGWILPMLHDPDGHEVLLHH